MRAVLGRVFRIVQLRHFKRSIAKALVAFVHRRFECGWEKWESGISGRLSATIPRARTRQRHGHPGKSTIDESPGPVHRPARLCLVYATGANICTDADRFVDVYATARDRILRRPGGIGGRCYYQLH